MGKGHRQDAKDARVREIEGNEDDSAHSPKQDGHPPRRLTGPTTPPRRPHPRAPRIPWRLWQSLASWRSIPSHRPTHPETLRAHGFERVVHGRFPAGNRSNPLRRGTRRASPMRRRRRMPERPWGSLCAATCSLPTSRSRACSCSCTASTRSGSDRAPTSHVLRGDRATASSASRPPCEARRRRCRRRGRWSAWWAWPCTAPRTPGGQGTCRPR